MKACEAKVRLEVKEQLKELQDSKETIQKHIHEYSLLQNTINGKNFFVTLLKKTSIYYVITC